MYKTSELFDLTKSAAGGYLAKFEYPWQALAGLKEEILRIGGGLDKNEYAEVSAGVWVPRTYLSERKAAYSASVFISFFSLPPFCRSEIFIVPVRA